ncbi:LOW QUALITY PROTEIN: hypothetical protein ElyMa_004610500 [Elysia marginata]|uniref:Uncharacterized protein n=1 Tax=Elysia marginata TaxID=1093978 RepID=A0AAV4I0V0_9GAST|nr:LOW QUALITY PROTEIN: hypothetical protein ElyMa_004610500 [Elysia marginata]
MVMIVAVVVILKSGSSSSSSSSRNSSSSVVVVVVAAAAAAAAEAKVQLEEYKLHTWAASTDLNNFLSVLPSLQFDDSRFRQGLSSAFDSIKRSAASLRGNLEFVGPLGGKYEANLDGAIKRIGNLFNAETSGHLKAGVRRRGLLGGVQGTAGAIQGVLRRAPGALGADVAARLDNVHGNIFTGVHRNGVKGDLSFGSGTSRGFPFDSAFSSGLLGRAMARHKNDDDDDDNCDCNNDDDAYDDDDDDDSYDDDHDDDDNDAQMVTENVVTTYLLLLLELLHNSQIKV